MDVLAKLASESMLSLYPVFVKNIDIPITMQMWTRFVAYAAISIFFVDHRFVWSHIRSRLGMGLILVTIVHVYASYRGFEILKSGPSYTLFYTYPAFILMFMGYMYWTQLAVMLLGVYFILDMPTIEGVVMMLLAAMTEALIFVLVKKSTNTNPWNFLFISYIGGAILLSFLLTPTSFAPTTLVAVALSLNALLGIGGYYLRFYSIINQGTLLYAALSYAGIGMSYLYGWYFSNERPTTNELIGTAFIILSSIWIQHFHRPKV